MLSKCILFKPPCGVHKKEDVVAWFHFIALLHFDSCGLSQIFLTFTILLCSLILRCIDSIYVLWQEASTDIVKYYFQKLIETKCYVLAVSSNGYSLSSCSKLGHMLNSILYDGK